MFSDLHEVTGDQLKQLLFQFLFPPCASCRLSFVCIERRWGLRESCGMQVGSRGIAGSDLCVLALVNLVGALLPSVH